MNLLKRILYEAPWGLIIAVEFCSCMLLIGGNTDGFGIVTLVSLSAACWFNGSTSGMKVKTSYLVSRMELDAQIIQRLLTVDVRYRRLRARYEQMTGEDYIDEQASTTIYQA
jgi:hypothetical protein